MPTRTSRALILLPLLALAACGAGSHAAADYRPTLAAPPPPARVADGAIFHAEHGYAPLTSGTRASMVGDIITIALVERTQAAKSNSAGTSRSGSIGLTGPSTGPLDFFNPSDARASGDLSFSGKGSAEQSNTLSGEITVTVAEVFPNGTMLVRGEKLVTLNRGDEYVRISGLVRPQDVTADNRIASTRVADARITYSGSGEIAVASRQGWLQRFFSAVSPF